MNEGTAEQVLDLKDSRVNEMVVVRASDSLMKSFRREPGKGHCSDGSGGLTGAFKTSADSAEILPELRKSDRVRQRPKEALGKKETDATGNAQHFAYRQTGGGLHADLGTGALPYGGSSRGVRETRNRQREVRTALSRAVVAATSICVALSMFASLFFLRSKNFTLKNWDRYL